jgi:hypothetical protein
MRGPVHVDVEEVASDAEEDGPAGKGVACGGADAVLDPAVTDGGDDLADDERVDAAVAEPGGDGREGRDALEELPGAPGAGETNDVAVAAPHFRSGYGGLVGAAERATVPAEVDSPVVLEADDARHGVASEEPL